MNNNEGYSITIIPQQEKKSCWGCKWFKHEMVKSGFHPIYNDNCKHPDLSEKHKIFYSFPYGNINTLDRSTPDWCPVGIMKDLLNKETNYKIHELKTWPEYFKQIFENKKKFDIRANDRDFKVGDRLDLMEYNPETNEYTGNHCHVWITHIMRENPFIDLGNKVIMSITKTEPS